MKQIILKKERVILNRDYMKINRLTNGIIN